MEFEWDPAKSEANKQKHGLDFREASAVFANEALCLDLYDETHSDIEERFITIGPVRAGLVLVVWTERHLDTIRIISARFATTREAALYHRRMERP